MEYTGILCDVVSYLRSIIAFKLNFDNIYLISQKRLQISSFIKTNFEVFALRFLRKIGDSNFMPLLESLKNLKKCVKLNPEQN